MAVQLSLLLGAATAAADTSSDEDEPMVKVMSVDQSIASSTTLTNVTDLVFAIGANETWVYEFVIEAGNAMQTTGADVDFTVPAGATYSFNAFAFADDPSIYPVYGGSDRVSGHPSFPAGQMQASHNVLKIRATVFNGATPGNV